MLGWHFSDIEQDSIKYNNSVFIIIHASIKIDKIETISRTSGGQNATRHNFFVALEFRFEQFSKILDFSEIDFFYNKFFPLLNILLTLRSRKKWIFCSDCGGPGRCSELLQYSPTRWISMDQSGPRRFNYVPPIWKTSAEYFWQTYVNMPRIWSDH